MLVCAVVCVGEVGTAYSRLYYQWCAYSVSVVCVWMYVRCECGVCVSVTCRGFVNVCILCGVCTFSMCECVCVCASTCVCTSELE